MVDTSQYGNETKQKSHMCVPMDLFFYARAHNAYTEVATYNYLKWIYDGPFDINKETIEKVMKGLGIKKSQTVQKYIKKLIDKKWLYKSKGRYRLKGFNKIGQEMNFTRKKRALLFSKDFKNYKSHIASTVITYVMRKKFHSNKRKGLNLRSHAAKRNYKYTLPFRYLAKFFDIPDTTARDLIKRAIKGGYIYKEEDWIPLDKIVAQNFVEEINGPDVEERKIIWRKGQKCEQLPTKYETRIILK